jgi:hypothetical protein
VPRKLLIILVIQATVVDAQTRPSMFVFQDNFWLNLHQFLRGEVYRRGSKLQLGVDPDVDRYNQLTPVERSALEKDWLPYLDGMVSFENAMHDLVRDAR